MTNQVRLNVQAGSIALNLRVGGIPSIPHGRSVTLTTDDGTWAITIDRENPEFAKFDLPPGSVIVASITLVRPWLEQILPEGIEETRVGSLILPKHLPSRSN